MQDHYVADIGDYIKYALLRALSAAAPGPLGVAWYMGPGGDTHNGGHRAYLGRPQTWRPYDPALFDGLAALPMRSMRTVERAAILPPDTRYAGAPIPSDKTARPAWCAWVRAELADCAWVFADPDVGLAGVNHTRSPMHVPLEEALDLAAGRPLVVYHHHGRPKGGHKAEVERWLERMPPGSGALYARPWAPRSFFLLHMTEDMTERARVFAHRWAGRVDWLKG
jgi:hypothetical protein